MPARRLCCVCASHPSAHDAAAHNYMLQRRKWLARAWRAHPYRLLGVCQLASSCIRRSSCTYSTRPARLFGCICALRQFSCDAAALECTLQQREQPPFEQKKLSFGVPAAWQLASGGAAEHRLVGPLGGFAASARHSGMHAVHLHSNAAHFLRHPPIDTVLLTLALSAGSISTLTLLLRRGSTRGIWLC